MMFHESGHGPFYITFNSIGEMSREEKELKSTLVSYGHCDTKHFVGQSKQEHANKRSHL